MITIDNASSKPGLGIYGLDPAKQQWVFISESLTSSKLTFEAETSMYVAAMSYTNSFSDISNHWAKNSIDWMAARMLAGGYEDQTFRPNQSVTRAEFTAFIVRMLGLEAKQEEASGKFNDVQSSDWYYEAVKAADQAGLVAGSGEGNFAPNALITREQMAAIVWRAYEKFSGNGYTVSGEEQANLLQAFDDKSAISDWAKASVASSVKEGLIQGVSSNQFQSSGLATRAQAVTLLNRLSEKLEQAMIVISD
ncbi:Endo-1,4-beta-xylanase A precursor [compost metagenome]